MVTVRFLQGQIADFKEIVFEWEDHLLEDKVPPSPMLFLFPGILLEPKSPMGRSLR